MIVDDLITSIDRKMPNTYDAQDKLDWINDVELASYTDTVKEFISTYIPLTADQAQYGFPTGVTILTIESVFLNGSELTKRDLRQKITGYYKEGDKLTLCPVPSQSDTAYVSGVSQITFASGSITTTGTDFSGFAAGDTVLVSGATTAANNKYAVITAVAAKVLSFSTGTFSAGLNTAAVTVSLPSLEVVSRYKPAAKILANIATDTLLLPDAFVNAYRYYGFGQICFLREQFDKGNNWMAMYNSRISDFRIWYENNRPKQHVAYKRRW